MLTATYYNEHDGDVDILRLKTTEWEHTVTCSHLEDDLDVLVCLGSDEGTHVVGLEVMAASFYLPLGKRGYDADADTLTLGDVPAAPAKTTENADIITYWQPDNYDCMSLTPVAVTIRRASEHLNGVFTGAVR